ncbi:50S ribosomal protein L10 [Marinicella meishanensis]|uniref:50S ribosomal protein L10 n=1 Tax=Marinicella meishanensis TaxID=2873263 RepID=UPI001CC06CCB|nr:50S ribosomal protein L10 [Marinicella sp. NBU2979]
MALNLEQKKAVVSEIANVAQDAHSLVAAEYRGSSVDLMTAMRSDARKTGVYLRVAKNTLVKRAVQGTEYECIADALVGPLLYAFSQEDPGCAARLIKDHAKDNDHLEVKFVSIGGSLLAASELARLASLPTKDQAISQLMSVMKAPIEKLARTLAEPHAKLTRTIAAIKDSKAA